ncbi:uncharacterized protein LOC130731900 [Lotus japonicus]|uniref:uncharacterized protein LOC130731900 n=1 Tax=Lotus japonicus TaxID=34305 RepID=UPI002585325D|nr:uncharacterized protein LOC130731900 [Lotus japonicus]
MSDEGMLSPPSLLRSLIQLTKGKLLLMKEAFQSILVVIYLCLIILSKMLLRPEWIIMLLEVSCPSCRWYIRSIQEFDKVFNKSMISGSQTLASLEVLTVEGKWYSSELKRRNGDPNHVECNIGTG